MAERKIEDIFRKNEELIRKAEELMSEENVQKLLDLAEAYRASFARIFEEMDSIRQRTETSLQL